MRYFIHRSTFPARSWFAVWDCKIRTSLQDNSAVTRGESKGQLAGEIILKALMVPYEQVQILWDDNRNADVDLSIAVSAAALNLEYSEVKSLPQLIESALSTNNLVPATPVTTLMTSQPPSLSADSPFDNRFEFLEKELKNLQSQPDEQKRSTAALGMVQNLFFC